MKKRWYDYLWIASLLYLTLGFFNILFACLPVWYRKFMPNLYSALSVPWTVLQSKKLLCSKR